MKGAKDSCECVNGVLTSGAAVGFFCEELLDFLREVSLGAPDEAYHAEHHEHCDEPEPERLVKHALSKTDYIGRGVWDLASKTVR